MCLNAFLLSEDLFRPFWKGTAIEVCYYLVRWSSNNVWEMYQSVDLDESMFVEPGMARQSKKPQP